MHDKHNVDIFHQVIKSFQDDLPMQDLRTMVCLTIDRVTNFFLPVFCACSRVQNLQAPKGLWTASKALTGRNCNAHFMFRRARYQRRRGNGSTLRRRHVKLPRLARPKGCFDTSAEWS